MENKIWNEQIERETLKLLTDIIRIKSVNSYHNEMEVIKFLKDIFDAEGIENEVFESAPGRGNIVAKISGGKESPVLFLSHIDVVDVDQSKWLHDAFEAVNDNGIIYGRGTLDTKHLTIMQLMTMLMLKRNDVKLNRDVVFIATADEEAGSEFGMKFMVEHHGDKIPKGYVFNEGGGFVMDVAGKQFRTCACAEKGVCEVKAVIESGSDDKYDVGSSAIIKVSRLINKIASYESPEIICSTSQSFKDIAGDCIDKDQTLKNLWEYSVHNVMTVSKFNFEDCRNADSLEVTVSFRFIPTISKEEALKTIEDMLAGIASGYEIVRWFDGYESCITDSFIEILAEKSNEFAAPATLLPMVALGNTDGRFIGHNVYGYSPLLGDIPFCEVLKKVHLHNECISEQSMIYGTRVIFETVMALLQNN